jgi:hypothetical protein
MSKVQPYPVLEIVGTVPHPAFPELWNGYKHERINLEDFVSQDSDARYARVLLADALQRVAVPEARSLLERVKKHLAPGGRVHIMVPAIEWACRQLLMDNPHPAVPTFIWGTHETPKHCYHGGWTMRMLRGLCDVAGLSVVRAETVRNRRSIKGEADIVIGVHVLEAGLQD